MSITSLLIIEITLFVIYTLSLVYTIGKIFEFVKTPSKTLSWVLVVILIPFFGIILYHLIGRKVNKQKLFHQKSPFYYRPEKEIFLDKVPRSKLKLIKLLRENNSSALSYGNQVTVLKDGPETFQQMFESMKKANSTIHLDYYIVESGKMLDELIEIFEDRIKNGVKIRLIYDGFGTYNLKSVYINKLKSLGVECKEFIPFHLLRLFKFLNFRNHRKIVIVDNKVAFTGGMNISDKYIEGDKKLGRWRDTYLMVEGPAAQDFEHVLACDWYYAGGKKYILSEVSFNYLENGCSVQVVASGPDSEHQGIMQEYFSIITSAEKYVYIVTPYFIPSEAFMTALKTAALGGIDVQIMLPYDSDSKWMKWCMYTYIEELLASQVRIFLFHDGFLHSKVVLSDDIVSSVGTANIDERSFEANFEINAIVYDKKTTLILKNDFEEDKNSCEELSLGKFPHRKDRNKYMEPIARLTSSML